MIKTLEFAGTDPSTLALTEHILTKLYAGLRKLVDDLNVHIFLENTGLVPRFEVKT